jgi:K+-transporting ATPase ATPase C chain
MRQLKTACLVLGVFSLLLGIVYPLVMTGVAQLLFPRRASGSLLTVNGRVIGSELIGQSFASPGYFHGRPSDCGYDATHSGSSNLGPSNPDLAAKTGDLVRRVRAENALPETATAPPDLVLASGSGLDPDISPEAAYLQVERVAHARGVESAVLHGLVERNTQKPFLGVFGMTRVNVLKLNLALDSISSEKGR